MTSRMSPALVAAATILVLATAPAAHADSSLFLGVGFPTGGLADATTAGWTMGGHATSQVLPLIDVGAYVAYTDFTVDTTEPGAGRQFGASLSTWELEALGQVNVAFFKGFLGLGLANYSGRDDAGDPKRKSDFAWQIGAAAQFFFLETRLAYHQIETDGTKPGWVGLSFGILF